MILGLYKEEKYLDYTRLKEMILLKRFGEDPINFK